MKKLIISALLIAIPTISNAARDCSLVSCPIGQSPNPITCACQSASGFLPNPDIPINPQLCPGMACEEGYDIDYLTCECVPSSGTGFGCDLTVADCTAQNTKWVSAGVINSDKIRATHYILQEATCECKAYYVYGCADGYYGLIQESTSSIAAQNSVVCTPCPDGGTSTSLLGLSANPPAWSMASNYNGVITSCYLPANTPVRGAHGKYICGSQMKYSLN